MGDGTAALSAAHRYWSWLEDGMNLVAAAAIFFLMFVGVFQIVGRTVFDTAIYGYIDYMEQASALFAFLGISYAQRVGAHIRMDLLLRGFSLRFLWSMELFCVLVALVVITVLVYSDLPQFPAGLAARQFDHRHQAAGLADQADRAVRAGRPLACASCCSRSTTCA